MPDRAYQEQCRRIAQRFLQTVVVFDDAAWNGTSSGDDPRAGARAPGRKPPAETASAPDSRDGRPHSLDTQQLVSAFARRGIVCSAIAVPNNQSPAESVENGILEAARRADVVILDWQMPDDDGKRAIRILNLLRTSGGKGRLRITAIYTGENDLLHIRDTIAERMGWNPDADGSQPRIRRGGFHVFLYAKEDARLTDDLKGYVLPPSELPRRLIQDFAGEVGGLLPNLVMASLTSVRDNGYHILKSFDRELDPAFLTHRAYLDTPGDADRHVVDQLANELRAVMAENACTGEVANSDAFKGRVADMWGPKDRIEIDGREFDRTFAARIAANGYKELRKPPLELKKGPAKKAFKWLSRVFLGGGGANSLDLEFAYLMTSRSVGPKPPTLHLGSLLVEEDEEKQILLCMTPSCDSVRLEEATNFLFVPLRGEKGKHQVVVWDGEEPSRKAVQLKIAEWHLIPFEANESGVVAATLVSGARESWHFEATSEGDPGEPRRFRWLGELRQEFAQKLAHTLGSTASRVATDTPEWLRRHERS